MGVSCACCFRQERGAPGLQLQAVGVLSFVYWPAYGPDGHSPGRARDSLGSDAAMGGIITHSVALLDGVFKRLDHNSWLPPVVAKQLSTGWPKPQPSRAVGRAPHPTGPRHRAGFHGRRACTRGVSLERATPLNVGNPVCNPLPRLSPSRSTPGGSYPTPTCGACPAAVVAALRYRPCSGVLRRGCCRPARGAREHPWRGVSAGGGRWEAPRGTLPRRQHKNAFWNSYPFQVQSPHCPASPQPRR